MTPEIWALCAAAASIAFLHTIMGPDHYLPFVALARSRDWSLARTLRVTLLCGAGHIVGSVVLGLVGIYASIELGALELIEGFRGDIAAWALVSIGLVWLAWGLRRAYQRGTHAHWHSHDGVRHFHAHRHKGAHSHLHDSRVEGSGLLAGWAIFLVFILGPCEPLIPVLMFPAAKENLFGLLVVTAVFSLVTVLTMLAAVALSLWGLKSVRVPALERYNEAMAGGAIMLCGLSIALLGL